MERGEPPGKIASVTSEPIHLTHLCEADNCDRKADGCGVNNHWFCLSHVKDGTAFAAITPIVNRMVEVLEKRAKP